MDKENQGRAISLVTKKALVSIGGRNEGLAFPMDGSVVWGSCFIIEYEVGEGARIERLPTYFRVIGLGNGKKLQKSFVVMSGYQHVVYALVELSDQEAADLLSR